MTATAELIPLVEIAGTLGTSLDAAANMAGDQVRLDWANRPVVPAVIAAAIIRGRREHEAQLADRDAAYGRYCAEREQRRAAKMREVAGDTYRRIYRPARGFLPFSQGRVHGDDKEAKAEARAAAIEARGWFDGHEPRLSLEQWLETPEGKAYR